MANIDFQEAAESLQLKAAEAPLPYLSACLRQATIEFCEESESFVHRLDPIVVIAGENEYELDLPAKTRVVKAVRMLFEGRPLEPTSETLLDDEMPKWETTQSTPSRYFIQNGMLYLAPVPPRTTAAAVTGSVCLKPARSATGVDEDFFDENAQALFDGALKIAFSDLKRPWGDGSLMQMHDALFREAVENAKSKARQDHTAKRRTMSYGG